MKTPEEVENRILILFASQSLKNKASKKNVLDFLKKNNFIILNGDDIQLLETRKEEKWRNKLAYVRHHLVNDGYLSNDERDCWKITERGKIYYKNEILKLDKKSLIRIKDPSSLNKFD